MKKIWFKYICDVTLVGIIAGMFVLAVIGLISIARDIENKNSPVKDMEVVDSLIKVNDSLKIQVNNLDSIKDAKIIEVTGLDNDSTVKLFYELVKR